MDFKKTGGPAFPTSDHQVAHEIATAAISGIDDPTERDRVYTAVRGQSQQGMTLRDHFAGLALPSILAQSEHGIQAWPPGAKGGGELTAAQGWAADAYAIADAMLAERAK